MFINKAIGIIGGDARTIELANALYADGNSVIAFGMQKADKLTVPHESNLNDITQSADIIILPLPLLNESGNVFAPFSDEAINPTEIIRKLSKDQIVLAGRITNPIQQLFSLNNIRVIDYFEQEDLTITNAMITAEGAISTILNNYPKTLCNSKVLLLGYGRIGKFLVKILSGFGAQLDVAGRRYETNAWIKSSGLNYVDLNNKFNPSGYDIIINTIPHPILTKDILDQVEHRSLILDLASGKGGTDFNYASKLGIKAIHALSLPGKTAPIAAGEAIKRTIENILISMEV